MNDQEMNLAIAESLGWEHCDHKKYGTNDLFKKKGGGFNLRKNLPSYTSSLNAMREALEIIYGSGMAGSSVDTRYSKALDDICRKDCVPIWYSSAKQQATAYLTAIRKLK